MVSFKKNSQISKLYSTGFFSIFMSTVLCKILTFIGGMVIVRILSKSDYGQYSYIMNCFSMLILLNDFGTNMAALQFCSEHYNNETKANAYFSYGYKKGIVFSIFTVFIILSSSLFYPYNNAEAEMMTRSLCLMPLITTTNAFLMTNLRVKLKNNSYAKINVFNTVVQYLVILPLAYFWGIVGAVLSNYLISFLVLIYSMKHSKSSLDFNLKKIDLTKNEKKEFLKLSFASQINSCIDTGRMLFDVFFISLIVTNMEIISSYKVATIIPTALLFIPSAVMIYAVPHFSRNANDKKWIRKYHNKLIIYGGIVNGCICMGSIVLSKWFIPLIFGKNYSDAVSCFIIIMIGYFFSATFRIPASNIIYTQKKVKINILITVICAFVNIGLDIWLIIQFGSIGAAYATTITNIINAVISYIYLKIYLREKKLFKKGTKNEVY